MARIDVLIKIDAQGASETNAAIAALRTLLDTSNATAGGHTQVAQAAAKAATSTRNYADEIKIAQRQLAIHAAELAKINTKYGEGSTQSQKKQIAIDKLTLSIQRMGDAEKRAQSSTSTKPIKDTSAQASQAQAAAAAKAVQVNQALAASEVRAAVATKDHGRALAILEREIRAATAGTARYNDLCARQAIVARQAALDIQRQADATRQVGVGAIAGQIGLGAFFSTAAIGTLALAGLRRGLDYVAEGFTKLGNIEAARRNLGTLLGDVQKGDKIFEEAAAFARKYAYGQEEIAKALGNAAPILKTTSASTEEVLSTLARLGELNPAEGIEGATFAMKELIALDTTSLAERFNISRQAANALKNEIKNGKDPILVMDKALNDMGATSQLLQNRLLGSKGEMTQLKAASEELQIALGGLAGEFINATDVLPFLIDGIRLTAVGMGILKTEIDGVWQSILNIVDPFRGMADAIAAAHPAAIAAASATSIYSGAISEASAAAGVHADAQQKATDKVTANTQALYDQIIKQGESGQAALDHASAESVIERAMHLSTKGTLGNAAAMILLAKHFKGVTIDGELLIDMHKRLAAAQKGEAVGAAASAATIAAAKRRQAAIDAERELNELLNPQTRINNLQDTINKGDISDPEYYKAQAELYKIRQQNAEKQKGIAERAAAAERAYLDQVDKSGERQRLVADLNNAIPGTEAYYKAKTALAKFDEDVAERRKKALEKEAKAGEKSAKEAEKLAEDIKKAQFDLLSPTEQLLQLQRELAANPPELERLQLTKEIRDLQEKIDKDRIDAAKTALDLEKGIIDDRQARRVEDQQRKDAERIINSRLTTPEQKAAARDRLAEIDLDRRTRAQEMAQQRTDAGMPGATLAAATRAQLSGGSTIASGLPVLPMSSTQPGAAGGAGAIQIVNNITLEMDGKIIGQATATSNGGAIANLRIALKHVNAGGQGLGGF